MRRGIAIDVVGNVFDVCRFERDANRPTTHMMYAIREVKHVANATGPLNGWMEQTTFDLVFADRVVWKDPDAIDETGAL